MRKMTIEEVQPGMDVIYEKTDRKVWVSSFMVEGMNIPVSPIQTKVFKGKVLDILPNYSSLFPDEVLVCDEKYYEKYKHMDFFDVLNQDSDTFAIRSIGLLKFTEPNKRNKYFKESLKDWGDRP